MATASFGITAVFISMPNNFMFGFGKIKLVRITHGIYVS